MKSTLTHRFCSTLQTFFQERPYLAAALLGLLSIAIHLPLALFDALGEQDAARLCNLAVTGVFKNNLELPGQWAHAYPLYIHAMYALVKHELLLPSELPAYMTGLSVITSGIYSATFFLFFRLTTDKPAVAAAGALILQLVPAHFISSLYGFPTIAALGVFMTAAWLSAWAALTKMPKWRRVLLIIGAVVLFQAAVLLKVDVVTGAGLFCLPWCRITSSIKRRAVFVAVVFVISVAAFILLNQYGGAIAQQEEPHASWQSWTRNFYAGLDALTSRANQRVISHALGVATPLCALCAAGLLLYRREQRLTLFWVAAAALPGALFWALMAGNSARHNLLLSSLLPIVIALPLASVSATLRRYWGGAIVILLLVNYFWYAPSPSTVRPSGRLFESAVRFKEASRALRARTASLARIDAAKVAAVLHNHRRPYFYFEIISDPSLEITYLDPDRLVVRTDDQKEKEYRFMMKPTRRTLRKLKKKGFVISYPNKK